MELLMVSFYICVMICSGLFDILVDLAFCILEGKY